MTQYNNDAKIFLGLDTLSDMSSFKFLICCENLRFLFMLVHLYVFFHVALCSKLYSYYRARCNFLHAKHERLILACFRVLQAGLFYKETTRVATWVSRISKCVIALSSRRNKTNFIEITISLRFERYVWLVWRGFKASAWSQNVEPILDKQLQWQ